MKSRLLALLAFASPAAVTAQTPAALRAIAHGYYAWRDAAYPVASSDRGKHTWDAALADYRMPAVRTRRAHVDSLLATVKALRMGTWSKDDRVDKLLFEAQLEGDAFFPRVMRPEESDPQVYVNEAANGIFSLLKKDYAPQRTRALAAAARLEQVPSLLATARTNLTSPVKLYAQLASESARGGDDLYITSLMTLADSLDATERGRLIRARDNALTSLHQFADWLDARSATMADWRPMGETQYNYLLNRVLLLPFDAREVATLGEVELARYRALESWLKNPAYASPDPARAARLAS